MDWIWIFYRSYRYEKVIKINLIYYQFNDDYFSFHYDFGYFFDNLIKLIMILSLVLVLRNINKNELEQLNKRKKEINK